MFAAVVDIDKCIGCGDCIDSCPVDALYLRDAYVDGVYNRSLAIVKAHTCISCDQCVPVCVWGALSLIAYNDYNWDDGSNGTDVISTFDPNSMLNIEEYVIPSDKDFDEDCISIYNGNVYTGTDDLMVDIMLENARKQLGINDVAALLAILSGANIIGTRKKFGGTTKGTSIASKYISGLIPGNFSTRLPTLTGYPGLGSGLKFVYTKNIGRFVGRTIPVLGWGIIAYDLYKILEGTYKDYTKATENLGC